MADCGKRHCFKGSMDMSQTIRRQNLLMLTPAQGAITQLWAGVEKGIEKHNGAVRKRLASSGTTTDHSPTILVLGAPGKVR